LGIALAHGLAALDAGLLADFCSMEMVGDSPRMVS
jgi:hypothetical protein